MGNIQANYVQNKTEATKLDLMQMGRIGEELDIDFVISAGDNFYEDGLTGIDDKAFEESFTNIYTAKSLQKPWYTSKLSKTR